MIDVSDAALNKFDVDNPVRKKIDISDEALDKFDADNARKKIDVSDAALDAFDSNNPIKQRVKVDNSSAPKNLMEMFSGKKRDEYKITSPEKVGVPTAEEQAMQMPIVSPEMAGLGLVKAGTGIAGSLINKFAPAVAPKFAPAVAKTGGGLMQKIGNVAAGRVKNPTTLAQQAQKSMLGGQSFVRGSVVGDVAAEGAINIADKAMGNTWQQENPLTAMTIKGLAGLVGGGYAGYKAEAKYINSISNATNKVEALKKSGLKDEEIAKAINDNPESFGFAPQQAPVQQYETPIQPQAMPQQQAVDILRQTADAKRVERGEMPKYTQQYQTPVRVATPPQQAPQQLQMLDQYAQAYNNPRFDELMEVGRGGRPELNTNDMPMNERQARFGDSEDAMNASYAAQFERRADNMDYPQLNARDVKEIEAGRLTPELSQKLEDDLNLMDNSPDWAAAKDRPMPRNTTAEDLESQALFANGGNALGGAMGGGTLGGSEALYEDIVEGKDLSAKDYLARIAGGAAVGAGLGKKYGGKQGAPMFVGAKPDEKGAFSGTADKGVRKWIDDGEAKINKEMFEGSGLDRLIAADGASQNYKGTQTAIGLDEILDHPKLYNEYPELRDVNVFFDKMGSTRGSFDGENITINSKLLDDAMLNGDDGARSTLLHEIQHAIQDKEGWAKGGMPKEFQRVDDLHRGITKEVVKIDKALGFDEWFSSNIEVIPEILRKSRPRGAGGEDTLRYRFAKTLSPETAKKYTAKLEEARQIQKENRNQVGLKDGEYGTPHYNYQRLAGEQEARAAEAALKHPDKDPYAALKAEEGELPQPIVKMNGGGASQSADDTVKNVPIPDNMKANVSENDQFITLSRIKVDEAYRGEGKAREYMQNLIKYANSKGKKIALTPSSDFGASKSKLVNFYKSIGFDMNKGKNKDFETMEGMIKQPSQSAEPKNITWDDKPDVVEMGSGGNFMNSKAERGMDSLIQKGAKGIFNAADWATGGNLRKGFEALKESDKVNYLTGHKIYEKKDYMNMREKTLANVNTVAEKAGVIHEQLKQLSSEGREGLYDYMTGVKNTNLAPELKRLGDHYISEIDGMGKRLVDEGRLSQEAYDDWKGQYLHRKYTKHLGKRITDAVSGQRGFGVDQIKTRGKTWKGSEKEYQELLAKGEIGRPADGKVQANKRLDGKGYDLRRDWTPDERAKMGEIKDAAYSIPETMHRLATLTEYGKMMDSVPEKYMAPLDTKLTSQSLEQQGYKKLSGDKYGALNGRWVSKDIASDVDSTTRMVEDNAIKQGWQDYVSAVKSSHTIYNPTAHFNNFNGNVIMQTMAGLSPIKAYKYATQGVKMQSSLKRLKELEAKKIFGLSAEETAELNKISSNPDVQLWNAARDKGLFGRSRLNDVLNQYVTPHTNKADTIVGTIKDKAEKLYQGEDDVMRFSALKQLQEKGMGIEEAVKKINDDIIPDYTKPMSQGGDFLRRSGIAPFFSWTYYSTPMLMKQIRDHPTRAAALIGALPAINAMSGIYGNEDMPNQGEGYAGKTVAVPGLSSGNEKTMMRTGSIVPHTQLLEPGEIIRSLAVGGIPQQLMGAAAGAGGRNDMLNLFYGNKVTQKKGWEKAYQQAKHVAQNVLPSPDVLDKLWNLGESKVLDKKTRQFNKVVQPRSWLQELLNLGGINTKTYDLKKAQQENRKQELKNK